VFRVVVTDANGFHATDYVAVEVLSAVEAEVPPLALVDEAVELRAETSSPDALVTWRVVGGEARIDGADSPTATLTTQSPGTVDVSLTVSLAGGSAGGQSTRDFEIVSIQDSFPQVLIELDDGDWVLELNAERAPLHTANFLLYVDDGFFDGLLIHRIACLEDALTQSCDPFVVQGGGFERVDGELTAREPIRPPVPSEAGNGLSNGTVYSVALALSGGNPDSGTTQFFINANEENAFLDDQNFTVFGNIVEGTEIVDFLFTLPTEENPLLGGEPSLPIEDVVMRRVTRVAP
jgi:peptidyl-prolyl cis-trans isomerase B (cyclophilin B)